MNNIRVLQTKFHEDYLTGLKNMTTVHKVMKSMEHFCCKQAVIKN